MRYDNSGNEIQKGTQVYSWDAKNRLIQTGISGGGQILASYLYNGDNILFSRKGTSGQSCYYILDGNKLLLEMNASGNILRRYNPGISFVDSSGNKFFYQRNAHGDVADLLDRQGHLVQSYNYDAFGNVLGLEADQNPFRYVGESDVRVDDAAALSYMTNRWYDPELGRFISKDPFGLRSGTLNLYGYTENSPITNVDPLGFDSDFAWEYVNSTPISTGQQDFGFQEMLTKASEGYMAGVGAAISAESLITDVPVILATRSISFGQSVSVFADLYSVGSSTYTLSTGEEVSPMAGTVGGSASVVSDIMEINKPTNAFMLLFDARDLMENTNKLLTQTDNCSK